MKYNKKDLLDKRFGRLVVIEETSKREDGGSIVWKCKCDCGNIVEVSSKRLINKIQESCGCLQKEKQAISMKKLQSKQHIEKTNVDLIRKKEANSNSKTQTRGVCYITSKRKYKAYLYLNKEYHFLGYYDKLDDAIKARKEAEDKYFKPILDKYKKEPD